GGFVVLNAAPQERTEVVVMPGDVAGGQELADGSRAVLAHAPALGAGSLADGGDREDGAGGPQAVTAGEVDGDFVLDNGLVRV
ncbi:hypothetical protein G3I76_07990, partial [Streptomyces sp. SID11233]|nr:hypothetical protein [Streptomyces sp. SID11233]